jgi:hypothetical protein
MKKIAGEKMARIVEIFGSKSLTANLTFYPGVKYKYDRAINLLFTETDPEAPWFLDLSRRRPVGDAAIKTHPAIVVVDGHRRRPASLPLSTAS